MISNLINRSRIDAVLNKIAASGSTYQLLDDFPPEQYANDIRSASELVLIGVSHVGTLTDYNADIRRREQVEHLWRDGTEWVQDQPAS